MAGLYSPTASLTMRQLGYSVLPRVGANGGWANMAQVAQGMFRRWYGKGSVSQGELNAGLAPGGKVMQNLQTAVGDQTAQAMGPQLQMYNKLFQQGVSATDAQTMINDAAGNKNYDGTSAQKLLSNKYGIATSDLQKLKDTTAKQTGNTAGEMGGFDSALSQATTTVQKFDTVLGAILKMTGLGGVLGAAHGFSGAMGAVGGAVGGIFSKTVGMLSRFGGAAGNSLGPGGLAANRTTAGGTNGASPGSTTGSTSKAVSAAIKDAESQLGKPYVWGGDNPSVGFDCSGLIEWAYGQAGIKLPRTSQEQWAALSNRSVPLGKVRAGDIVFSAGSDGTATSPGHEAMMISDRQIIEAPYTGADIRIRAYNASEWQHAARPNGSMTNVGQGSSTGGASASNGTGAGHGREQPGQRRPRPGPGHLRQLQRAGQRPVGAARRRPGRRHRGRRRHLRGHQHRQRPGQWQRRHVERQHGRRWQQLGQPGAGQEDGPADVRLVGQPVDRRPPALVDPGVRLPR